jgi:phosphoglycolate phosphatase-like HAD superfamily hydrolase
MNRYLLLFDIDGTMLLTGGTGMAAMAHVATQLFGDAFSWEGVNPAGHLDPLIFAEAAANNGLAPNDEHHRTFRDAYLRQLRVSLDANRDKVRCMPGIAQTLALLRQREDVVLGLVTGNYSDAVPIKLAAIAVDPQWFTITAFGDEAATRPAMVELALRRYADMFGEVIDPHRAIIIGDTPRDIDCAHAHGCRCLAVATGRFSLDELRRAGADVAVSDLADPSPLLALLA